MIDIGRLSKRVVFYKAKPGAKDSYGRNTQDWEPYRTIWASVEPLAGREYLEAEREANEQNYKIFTRYYPDLNVNMVIGYKKRKFTIQSVINYREDNEMLCFMCSEKVGDTIG